MKPHTRSRLGTPVVLMGTLFIGLAILTACGREKTKAPPINTPSAAATAPVSVVSTPGPGQAPAPYVMVQADARVSSGTPGHVAAVGGDPGLTYKWFVDNGTIEGAADGTSILWTAGDVGYAHVYCAGTSEAKSKTVAMATVKIIQAPSITRFDGKPPILNPGEAVALGWDVQGATKLVLDPGGEDVTSQVGPAKEKRPQETTVYTLTATNEAGTVVTKSFSVKVVPPPVVKSLYATGAVAVGHPLSLVGEFSGGHAEIRKGDQVLGASDVSPLQVQTTLKDGDSFTIVVKGESGSSASSTRSFSLQGH